MIRNKIFIFEGIDLTGKTEIAKAFANGFRLSYFKNEKEHVYFADQDSKRTNFLLALEYEGPFLVTLLEQVQLKNGIVIDRSIPSEYVYSCAFQRATNTALLWELDARLASLGATIIYCSKRDIQFDSAHAEVAQVAEVLIHEYEDYLIRTQMKVIRVDTTSEKLKTELLQIAKQIGEDRL